MPKNCRWAKVSWLYIYIYIYILGVGIDYFFNLD